MSTVIPPRSAVDPAFTWNDASIFADVAACQAEFSALSASVDAFGQHKGQLNRSAATLAEALAEADDLGRRTNVIFTYVGMAYNVDTTNQEATALYGQALGLAGKVSAGLSFVEPELLAIGQAILQAWMQATPALAHYAHYVEGLFRRQAHVRSAEVEEVIGMAGEVFGSAEMIYSMLTNADMKFPAALNSKQEPFDVTQSNIDTLMENPDREVRRSAWENYFGGYKAVQNTMAASLATAFKRDAFMARTHGYASALDSALFPNAIKTEVFHNLIETVKKNQHIWHRYFAIRKQALGYETLHPYDVWVPLTNNPPVVPYQQGVDYIAEGLSPLGADYVNVLRRGCLEERWVDVYPNQGKTQGAFSSGAPGTHPFILMSYTDDLQSMSTLAHELGHSMHSYLTNHTQPLVYSNYSLFVAEVASNFNQAMTRAHLLKQHSDRDFQIAMITEAMYNFHRYFLQMPTLARFELEIHTRVERGDGVTGEDMVALMADLLAEAYGPSMSFDRSLFGLTWATFPHLYATYYVFQYATGISGANALASRILDGTPGAAEAYLGFLKSGSSAYPLTVLQRAGVDLTTPEPVERTFAVLESMVDRLEKLVAGK